MTPFTLVLLATLQVEYQPAQPRVGDPVTVTYRVNAGESVQVGPGEGYEIVSTSGSVVRVRSFRPGPFTLRGSIESPSGVVSFRGPEIRVASVLGPNDDLKPAPLVPPKPLERPPHARNFILGAGVFAALAWLLLFALGKLRGRADAVGRAKVEFDYAALVRGLRGRPFTQGDIAMLADATRRHLALGMELTTTELLESLASDEKRADAAREILSHGDLAKFAPWGSPAAGTDRLTTHAETLLAADERTTDAPVR